MDLIKELKDNRLIYAPQYSIEEIEEAAKALNLNYIIVDIMAFESDLILDHNCIIVKDQTNIKYLSEDIELKFYNKCHILQKCASFARSHDKKYIFLGDFGATIKTISNIRI